MVVLGPNPAKIRGLRTISDSDNETIASPKYYQFRLYLWYLGF